jgi:HK97 family phage major capsid protein
MADSKNADQILAEIKAASDDLRHNVGEWKGLKSKVDELSGQLKDVISIKDAVAAIETKLGRPGSPSTGGENKWRDHLAELVRKGDLASSEAKSYGPNALKAYGLANDVQGGYLVPPEFVAQIIEEMANSNPLLGLAWKVTTSREVIQIPKETGEPTAYWIGDTQTRQDAQNTHGFGLEEVHVRTLQSYVDLANTFLDD